MTSSVLNSNELSQIKEYLEETKRREYKIYSLYTIGPKKFEREGYNLALHEYPQMIKAAQGAHETLICVKTSSKHKFCYYINKLWPTLS